MSTLAAERGFSRDSLPVCLWRENPYGLVSWWDVEEFSAETLHLRVSTLEKIWAFFVQARPGGDAFAAGLLGQRRVVNAGEKQELCKTLHGTESTLRSAGLPTSAEAVNEFAKDVLESTAMPAEQVVSRIEEIQRTIRREMRTVVFLYVPAEDARRYREPLKDWEATVRRWPKVISNISESSVCFALGRFGASIFHVLLVAEFGVIQVGNLLGVSGDKPGWGCAQRFERILEKPYQDRSALEKQHSQLLKEIVPMIIAVKDSWRHKISHVDNQLVWLDSDFSPQIASEVISATRGFMRRLASELPDLP